MIPYRTEEHRIEIYTNVLPDGDIVIEDWGTSYQKKHETIIGQNGMSKLSFLALSSDHTVEFYSHSENVGLKILMTMERFKHRHINNIDALAHHGLKIVLKRGRPYHRVGTAKR